MQADDVEALGQVVADALRAARVDLLLHHGLTEYVVDSHRVVSIVAVFNDKLVVGAPDLHVSFDKLFDVIIGEVDEDRLVKAIGRVDGVGFIFKVCN